MKQTKICGFKFKKAQHIVELALLAPFVMFFVGIVYQIAITIHTNYKFNSSLYEAISFIALTNKITPETDLDKDPVELKNETVNDIKRYAIILLNERHAPARDSLELKLVSAGDIDFLIGMYRYTSTFKIFNGIDNFNPGSYNYLTIIPINSAILRKNSYDISNNFFENSYTIAPKEVSAPDVEENTDNDEDEALDADNFEQKTEEAEENNNIEIPEAQIQ